METTHKDKFESLWKDFIALFKGKLIEVSKKQKLTTPLARLILTDAASTWFSDYEINGRWLKKLTQEDASRAKLVRDILEKDMTLQEVHKKGELPIICDLLLPLATAGVGFAVSYYLGADRLVQTLSALIPGALTYPGVRMLRKSQIENNKQVAIDQYVAQLEKYYNSILSVISF